MASKGYATVKDVDIQCVWECSECQEKAVVAPDWYQENGTPMCPECGDDMDYIRTEIRKDAIRFIGMTI